MDPIRKLTEIFSEFPGIGPRQARRFVYFLLTRQTGYLKNLTFLLNELKGSTTICQSCFRFFPKDKTPTTLCPICRDDGRDKTELTIVSKDIDLENIEKAHVYTGLYFVIGGSVPILEKSPATKIRQKELMETITKRAKNDGLKEIILAMNLNPEGENTREYLESILRPEIKKHSLKLSTLGRGLSTGTELEYSDTETIKNAWKNRA